MKGTKPELRQDADALTAQAAPDWLADRLAASGVEPQEAAALLDRCC